MKTLLLFMLVFSLPGCFLTSKIFKPNPFYESLCEEAKDPFNAVDNVFINCKLEKGNYSAYRDKPSQIKVMTWNIERGYNLDKQIKWLNSKDSPNPHIILISEADKGCERSNNINTTEVMAKSLNMNYVFGVEFLELPRRDHIFQKFTHTCEHGNAILSKFPIVSAEVVRFKHQLDWYNSTTPRLGGRMALKAEIKVGNKIIDVYSTHLEYNVHNIYTRNQQANELARFNNTSVRTMIHGGDYNSVYYMFSLMVGLGNTIPNHYINLGYRDAHSGLSIFDRRTSHELILDMIFIKNAKFFNSQVCKEENKCINLSDHKPIWTTILVD
jgi:endonuclease/exonuclease/phosphatase family metal-dependent hydrolase